ncbi:YwqG family protein [Entamoeba marina]
MSSKHVSNEILEKIAGELISSTSIPAVKFDLVKEETTVFDSKIGGKPYLPKDFDYPKLKKGDNHPLVLLTQINFEEIDHIENFPTTGILQIYIDGDDPDFCYDEVDEPQCGFRVIYHENIIKDESMLVEPPEAPHEHTPYQCCLKMKGTKIDMPITNSDFRYRKLLEKYAAKYEVKIGDIDNYFRVNDCLGGDMTGIGGYASFTQGDYRDEDHESEYSITLFTCDSDTSDNVEWCDAGIANFFITKDDLLKKDFSKVQFSWDCC